MTSSYAVTSSYAGKKRAHILAALLALALSLGLLVGTVPAGAATSYDKTSAKERTRVDRVAKPTLRWTTCHGSFRCATATLPLDYDHPKGATTKVALLKRPASNPKAKIGTLFVNPGGPGGSGTDLALYATSLLSPDVLARFDVVGFDPRGVNASTQVRCFTSTAKQEAALAGYASMSFPDNLATARIYLDSARQLGRACASTGKPLSTAMSTAQVARDLDVLRRAVGDRRLSYLGFSYGTYLGQVYANMFPDRVRAVALDGVVDPTAWQGSTATRNTPQWDRLRSAEGSWSALSTILTRCRQVGPTGCDFAGLGDPTKNFGTLAQRLKRTPVLLDDWSGGSYSYGYSDLVGEVLGNLYATDGARTIDAILTELWVLSDPTAASTAQRQASRRLAQVRASMARRIDSVRPALRASAYDNSLETFTSVECTDSPLIDKIGSLPKAAAAADRRVPYFGAVWVWNAPACARDAFNAADEDAYRGSFTHRTRSPLLCRG